MKSIPKKPADTKNAREPMHSWLDAVKVAQAVTTTYVVEKATVQKANQKLKHVMKPK